LILPRGKRYVYAQFLITSRSTRRTADSSSPARTARSWKCSTWRRAHCSPRRSKRRARSASR